MEEIGAYILHMVMHECEILSGVCIFIISSQSSMMTTFILQLTHHGGHASAHALQHIYIRLGRDITSDQS